MRRLSVLCSLIAVVAAFAAAPAAAATPSCAHQSATMVGTPGRDRLIGTPGNDVIVGLGGSDYIDGRGGEDLICSGTGRDVVYGGPGNDHVLGGGGNDRLGAGPGRDHLYGEAGADRLYGADGDDSFHDGRGRDHINGGPGRDGMTLTSPGVGVFVDLGHGEFTTVDGAETVTAIENVNETQERDMLKGNAGPNVLNGGHGDRVEGRAGNDVLSGTVQVGGAGDDVLRDWHYFDSFVEDRRTLYGQAGDDRIIAWATSPYHETSAFGGPGDDRFEVRDDCRPEGDCERFDLRLAAGDGVDLIDVMMDNTNSGTRGNEPYVIDLMQGTVTNTVNGLVVNAKGFENVDGSSNDDTIIGTTGPNLLLGGRGNDIVRGAGGNDVLAGGTRAGDNGSDTLDAGPGAGDTCHTSSPPHGAGPQDTISRCEAIRGVSATP